MFNNGGRSFWSAMPPVTKNIIIINVLIMILTALDKSDFMYETFALFYPASQYFRPWQIVTHMFMHGGFWHLFFNMYTLLIFGIELERIWGPKKFLLFYFVTGIGAALFHIFTQFIQAEILIRQIEAGSMAAGMALRTLYLTPTVGASGAIYGVLLGFAMLFPNQRLMLLFPPIAIKAKWAVVVFAAIELVTGVFSMGGGIAHFAHLGGMLFGLIMILYWKKKRRMYEYYE